MIDAAAEHIAVSLIHQAYGHLAPDRIAGAVLLARSEPVAKAIKAMVLEAYHEGFKTGERRGRLELEREMAADWKPIAERVRGMANAPSQDELRQRREHQYGGPEYGGGPVEVW